MRARDIDGLLSGIAGILDTERMLLTNGRLDELAPISRQKDISLERLVRLTESQPPLAASQRRMLTQIRDRAAGNMALFAAVQDGLQSAQTRLEDIRRAAGQVTFYDRNGRGDCITTSAARHQRKA